MSSIARRVSLAQGHINAYPEVESDAALAEALADLRWWANRNGVSFSSALDESFVRVIHERVNRRNDGT